VDSRGAGLLLTEFDPQGQPVGRFGKPVVLTGAQRPLFEGDGIHTGTDALSNLSTAFGACQTGRAEVTLAFGGITLRGSRVMKVSTVDDRAFAYPKGGAPCPVVPAVESGALIEQLDKLAPHLGGKTVVTLTPTPAEVDLVQIQIESVIDALDERLGAIYLNCFGNGNFPAKENVAPLLRTAHDKGVLIVTGSQVSECYVEPSAYGAGQWLTECGAMPIGDMTPAAAHAKLYVALALGAVNDWQLEDMERFFLTPVAGELRA
jgi:L-asparaginase/Glu-tRNA(Gln) amidotransferase subunit D